MERKCLDLGVRFRWWQKAAGRIILAKRADGTYASTIGGTGLSIPRQVGKTFLVGAIIFALCLLRPGLTVIWTAHRRKTAMETFGKMQAFAKRKRVAPHIAKITLANDNASIEFVNNSRILFGARERGFGRGFDEVDVLVFDEAQILTDAALDDMVPAANQSRQPTSALLLFMGTPQRPGDPAEVWMRMRTDALSGEDQDTGWIELGAHPKFKPTPAPADLKPADWVEIARANPSFPEDTPHSAILRLRKKLGPDSFLREGLGIYDHERIDGGHRVVDATLWESLIDDGPDFAARPNGLGVDASRDREFSVSACWVTGEFAHIEEVWASGDEAATLRWVASRAGRRIPIVIDSLSPAASLIPGLKALGCTVRTGTASDMSKACGMWLGEALLSRLTHAGQPSVSDALAQATQRDIGNAGGWGWDRRDEHTNIAPLVAHSLARLAASLKRNRTDNEHPPSRTVGERRAGNRRAVVY